HHRGKGIVERDPLVRGPGRDWRLRLGGLHDRRPAGSETTLSEGGCAVSSSARRAIASVWPAMCLLEVRSIILTEVSCSVATILIGTLASNCRTIELCLSA